MGAVNVNRARRRSYSPHGRHSRPDERGSLRQTVAVLTIFGACAVIWNDNSDSMSQRDSGWIQLYAETNQEALDLHIQGYGVCPDNAVLKMGEGDGYAFDLDYCKGGVAEHQALHRP
jgi:Pyruvate/2-oxoacid:ferredoxin oxidoreductase delta subunit